jgi:hypothetical protein
MDQPPDGADVRHNWTNDGGLFLETSRMLRLIHRSKFKHFLTLHPCGEGVINFRDVQLAPAAAHPRLISRLNGHDATL